MRARGHARTPTRLGTHPHTHTHRTHPLTLTPIPTHPHAYTHTRAPSHPHTYVSQVSGKNQHAIQQEQCSCTKGRAPKIGRSTKPSSVCSLASCTLPLFNKNNNRKSGLVQKIACQSKTPHLALSPHCHAYHVGSKYHKMEDHMAMRCHMVQIRVGSWTRMHMFPGPRSPSWYFHSIARTQDTKACKKTHSMWASRLQPAEYHHTCIATFGRGKGTTRRHGTAQGAK